MDFHITTTNQECEKCCEARGFEAPLATLFILIQDIYRDNLSRKAFRVVYKY